ncbi:putative protein kinase RLK-Pelle-DLSV family [Helianthus annuus]|nr:putative protein kinase RLK-Pelle-DLSV family [Helianthus annuus]KAJ0728772.1 putative protein kinase RLK-Pelle-DLSV family [Helianthus annuus]
MEKLALLFLYSSVLIPIFITCAAKDTITVGQVIRDGDSTLVSADETYELGFFSPGSSRNRFLGIWFKNISPQTAVWVANTEAPLTNVFGELRVSHGGLQLFSGNNMVIWSTNSSGYVSLGILIWQSFDHPGDTLLPGMRIGVDLVTGKSRHLTSWKTEDDPSAGPYVLRVAPNGYPQLFETQNLDSKSRFGPWNGATFKGMPDFGGNSIQFIFNDTGRYFGYNLVNSPQASRMRLKPDGDIEYLNWINLTQSWNAFSTATNDNCASYSICGPYGVCNIDNTPACSCLDGFEPRNAEDWRRADWSSGCQRIEPLACGNENGYGDSFPNITGVKFPDTNVSWYNQSMTLAECEVACKRNCLCMAYANSDITNGGSGCLLWFSDLVDIRLDDETQQLYIRMPASELTSRVPARNEKCANESGKEDKELSSYSLSIIANSTNNFSLNNKLGEGGFGSVYKGVLEDRQEIAVKRLSETSTQGQDEFKNEVKFIAKLQHRNLVKLIGYCIQEKERMLIYEYMAKKSLDSFIFG